MTYSLIFSVFSLSTFIHFITNRLFLFYKKYDKVNSRSIHNSIATRSGGIGIFFSLFLVSLYFYLKNNEIFDFTLLIPLGIIFFVGVYDDIYSADFKLKFFLQIIVAKILIDQGYVIDNFHGFLGIYEITRVFSQLITAFVFIIIVNAFNFVDGIDGLAITLFIKSILLIEFLSAEFTPFFYLSLIIISSLISLYYFNFRGTNKVFLGDAGSLFLGSIISLYIFFIIGENYEFKIGFQINKTLFSILIVFYPLMDLIRVFILRVYHNTSPFKPDQNHIHHFLVKKLNSHSSTLILIISLELLILFSAFLFV